MIVVIPIIILELLLIFIFYERHWENVTRRMESTIISEINLIINLEKKLIDYHKTPAIASNLQFIATIIEDKKLSDIYVKKSNLNPELKRFFKKIKSEITVPFKATYLPDKSEISLFLELKDHILQLDFSSKRITSPTTYIFVIWMICAATLLIIVAIIFLKNQLRSIIGLATVAEKLGKGQEIGDFKPSGAREIRIVGKAFLQMKQRIKRQIDSRTEMLAHISHDLRTPLTRLKLHAELMKDKKNAREIIQDIQEMEELINGYLSFAKEEGNEESASFDICEELRNLAKLYNNKKLTVILHIDYLKVHMKKEAIKRALNNLINNALKYCKKKVILTINKLGGHLYITIDDDGSGIPNNKRKYVFKPFTKLDKKSDGFGLGLAIVKNIIYSHGGKLRLDTSPYNGLRVIVKLPL